MNTFNLIYKGLPAEDREKMQSELEALMKSAIEGAKPAFDKAIGEACRAMSAHVGFWGQWVEENGSQYEFLKTLRDGIFKSIKSTSPATMQKYEISDLVESWKKQFPDEWRVAVNAELLEENAKLKEDLKWERSPNRNRNY